MASFLVALVGRTMIVRQFIGWIRTAPAGGRAEATRSLARAWLISDLSDDDRAAAEGAFLRLLDDPSPLVRQAMADVFASSAQAPAVIVQALAVDQASVARPVLEYSPLLIDADLVDITATGNSEVQCAIARRSKLPASVCAAIAEVGTAAAALELIANASAKVEPISYSRIAERHGHLPAIREKMLMMEDLPSAIRLALVAKLSETLTQFVVGRNWLSADRAGRVARETSRRLNGKYRGAVARRRHAWTGAASPRDRTAHCRVDPARAVVGQSRAVRLCARGIVGAAASPGFRPAPRPRRRQSQRPVDPGRPAAVDISGVPRGVGSEP